MNDTHLATSWAKHTNTSVISILKRTEIKLFWKDLSDHMENRNGYEMHEPKKLQQGIRAEKGGFNSKRPQPNFPAVYCFFRFRVVVEVNRTACVVRKSILPIYKYDILYSLRIPSMHIMYLYHIHLPLPPFKSSLLLPSMYPSQLSIFCWFGNPLLLIYAWVWGHTHRRGHTSKESWPLSRRHPLQTAL